MPFKKTVLLRFTYLVIGMLAYGCAPNPDLGTPLEIINGAFQKTGKIHMLINPGQFDECDEVSFQELDFVVCFKSETEIGFISTADSGYKTKEGIKVGDAFSKLQKMNLEEPSLVPGWGRVVELPSGWYAAFDFKEPPTATSPVQFIFYNN